MIIGTQITHDGTGSSPYYSPSFPSGGEAAVFTVDVTHEAGSPEMTITVETKNAMDVSWTAADTFSSITAPGVATKDVGGLKELVRLAYTFTAGSAGDFFHVIVSAPAWRLYT